MLPGLIGCLCRCQRGAALAAKAAGWSVKETTRAALDAQGRATSLAILIGCLVLATATQTLHRWSLGYSGSETAAKGSYNPIRQSILCHCLSLQNSGSPVASNVWRVIEAKQRLSGASGMQLPSLQRAMARTGASISSGPSGGSAINPLVFGGIPRK